MEDFAKKVKEEIIKRWWDNNLDTFFRFVMYDENNVAHIIEGERCDAQGDWIDWEIDGKEQKFFIVR